MVAINRNLGELHQSFELLKKLESVNRGLANACGSLAINAAIEAGDFAMAQRHWPLPEDALLQFSDALNDEVARYKRAATRFPPRLRAYVSIYCGNVNTTIEIKSAYAISFMFQLANRVS